MVVAHEPALDIEEPLLADVSLSDEPVSFSSFSEDEVAAAAHLDDDVAALAAQLEAFEANDQRETAREPDFTLAFDAKDEPAAAPASSPANTGPAAAAPRPAVGGFGFGSLELVRGFHELFL